MREVVARLAPAPPRVERSLLGEKAALTGAIARALQEARATLFAPRGADELSAVTTRRDVKKT